MRYNFADTLADYGFSYYEKLHSPIFLLDGKGFIHRVNEAGRKLLKVAGLDVPEIQKMALDFLKSVDNQEGQTETVRIGSHHKDFKVIAKHLESSSYLLVELIR